MLFRSVEHDLAVIQRERRIELHREHGGLRRAGGDQGAQGEVGDLRRRRTDECGDGLRLRRAELLQSDERLATRVFAGYEGEQAFLEVE